LLGAKDFREIVSGRRQGPIAAIARGLMRLAEFPYSWEVRRRNRVFDSGRRAAEGVSVPVISIGNLTLGGTGKTPMVAWVANWFGRRGIHVGLVSRGYKSAEGAANDEARELAQQLPGVPHIQNPDRVAAARLAVAEFGCQVILLDDGFQHRRLARDLDIVLLDALEPFGFGHVFPRGTLREPLAGLARADVVVLSRADMVDEVERARIRGVAERHAPGIAWAECRHAPRGLISAGGKELPLGNLALQPVAAFCGIGNPVAFRQTLDNCRAQIVAWREFPDHHHYSPEDLDQIRAAAEAAGAGQLICTHKDLVKIGAEAVGDEALLALKIEMEFTGGIEALEKKLQNLLERPATR
jgi:tetraacyldisaccharide 4'-kinase